MEMICASETSVDFQRGNHRCENTKTYQLCVLGEEHGPRRLSGKARDMHLFRILADTSYPALCSWFSSVSVVDWYASAST
jgi:hypothetical protein